MPINSNLSGIGFLDRFSTSLTMLLSDWLERLFGPVVNTPALGSVTWADLGVMLCFVLVVLFLNLVAFAFVRHKLKSTVKNSEDKTMRHYVLGALDKPLYVLIWICGVYFAATPL